jgi:hypothetical protein
MSIRKAIYQATTTPNFLYLADSKIDSKAGGKT